MQTLLEMSLSGAVMIGVIIIVRALAVNRLPKTAFLALWGAAFCCLILPMRIPSPISVYSAMRRRGDFPMPVRNWQRTGLLLTGNVAREASVPSLSPWLLLWIGGAVLLALVFLILHLRGRRVYAASLPVEQPFAKSWIEEHRLRRPVQVRYSDRIESPLTYGILWPVILLPADMDWKEERRRALFWPMRCPISAVLMRSPNGCSPRCCVSIGLILSYGLCTSCQTGIWSLPVTNR